MLAGIRGRSGPRMFQSSLIPPSFSPQRESRALLSPTPVTLAARESRALSVPYSRHSRRSGNPEPFPSPTPVILAAAGIQSPFRPLLPSFSPQRESRALSVPYSRHSRRSGNPEPLSVPYSRHSRRSGNPEPLSVPLLPSFSPQRESRALSVPYSRHSRRSGNPEPFPSPTPVILAAAGIQSPFRPLLPSFSPQRESRALSVCSEGCADMDTPGVGRPPPRHSRCG